MASVDYKDSDGLSDKKGHKQLERIKKNVEQFRIWFSENYKRFNDSKKFVFESSLSSDDKMLLQLVKKPQLEVNIQEAYISRLVGEFSKQQPSFTVNKADDAEVTDPQMLDVVEGHMRHSLCEANTHGCENNVYRDIMGGGFSAFKIWTDYSSERSHNQCIFFDKVFDPIMTGFDPLARMPSKEDGRFCFELYPQTREEFMENYQEVAIKDIKFVRSNTNFNWSYTSQKEDILLICDYYEKKKKRVRIFKLSDGQSMTKQEYEEFVEKWNQERIEQAPIIVSDRMTNLTTICRYRFIESEIIEYIETDFKRLPIIFVDGNSITVRNGGENGAVKQITRPYLYHAKDLQRILNFSMSTLANEIENMVMHKWVVAKESIPAEYQGAYTNNQLPSVLVHNAFKDNDPNVPVPAPREVQRTPCPPEVMASINMASQMMQTILGSYDAALGVNDNQLSGVAIVEGATQSNATAMPYVINFLYALNQVAQHYLDLIPKYYITPRTIPIVKADGKRSYIKINQPGGVNLKYGDNELQVKVEAGVNFSIQKNKALQQIIGLMQSSQIFAQFMNTEGLSILLDNLEIKGIDQLKLASEGYVQKIKQQQQQASQQPNPMIMKLQQEQQMAQQKMQLEQQKLAQQGQQTQTEEQRKMIELSIANKQDETERMRLQADIMQSQGDHAIQLVKSQTEQEGKHIDLMIKDAELAHKHTIESTDMAHRHAKDRVQLDHSAKELHHKLTKPGVGEDNYLGEIK